MTTDKPEWNISVKHLFSFCADQLNSTAISILSVVQDKILVGSHSSNTLFIYNQHGVRLQTINLIDKLHDAVWTTSGNIIYTIFGSRQVVTRSLTNEVSNRTSLGRPLFLSISYDDIVYLADKERGIYESTNDGFGWSHILQSAHGWDCMYAIRVISANDISYWTLEANTSYPNSHVLHIYNVVDDNKQLNDSMSRRKVNVPIIDTNTADSLEWSFLLHINESPVVLISDMFSGTVHALLTTGQYYGQILSDPNINYPHRIAAEKSHVFYVGDIGGTIRKYEIYAS